VNLTDPSGLSASLWEYLGIAEPAFGIVPPSGSVDEFLAWFDQYVDWLYNVFFPAIGRVASNVISAAGEFIGEALNAAIDLVQGVIDAVEKLPDALNDLLDFIEEQVNDVVQWIEDNRQCISLAIGAGALAVGTLGGGWAIGAAAVGVGLATGNAYFDVKEGNGDRVAARAGNQWTRLSLIGFSRQVTQAGRWYAPALANFTRGLSAFALIPSASGCVGSI